MGEIPRLKRIKQIIETRAQPPQPMTELEARSVFWKISILILLFASIFALGIILRVYNLNDVAQRSPDEYTYTYLAKVIVQHGVSEGIKLVTREQLSNKELWIYFPPPPTRTGYLWLLANVMKTLNSEDIKVGSYISFVSSGISLLLLIALGLRFFNPYVALYALLFMSVSPMELAIARRTWQDAMVGCLGLCLVYCSCEISRNIRKTAWYALLIVTGSYYISIKESGILIYGLCIGWLLWVLLIKEKDFLKSAFLIVCSTAGITITVAALLYIGGGISNIIASLRCWVGAIPTNQYAVEYQSGPWYYFLQGFWIVSPVSTILCFIGIMGALATNERLQNVASLSNVTHLRAIRAITLFLVLFMTIAMATPHFQNMRYVSVIYAPFYLISGLGLWYVISAAKIMLKGSSFHMAIIFVILLLIFMAVRDYNAFEKIFIRTGIKDVSIKMLRDYSR